MAAPADIASLTQQEAVDRAALLEVHRYDIEVDLTGLLDGAVWRATSTVSFACRNPGAATFVDVVGEIERATLNGVTLDAGTVAGGRLPLPGLTEENLLVVTTTQARTDRGEGILRTVDTDGLVYVWTSLEPDEARRLWACFDQPDLKAVHAFVAVAPAAWTVTSNSAPESVVDEPDSPDRPAARRWVFAPTPPLSTYVAVVDAGPFHQVRRTRDGYDLGLYCRQSLAAFLDRDAEEIFDLTARGLAWYGEQFDLPFPQERYDVAFVPNMGGAMENYGCVTSTDTVLFRSPPTYLQRATRANLLLHEMAHMWFGDIVTMRWWDDLWLNEAFASWAATWSMVGATEFTDAWADSLLRSKLLGYRQDMGPATHPIRAEVPDVAQAMATFDEITYEKGEGVLHQLATYVGDEAFVAGLSAYFRAHRWSNTTLDDLMAAFAAASGRDLGPWTTAWLDRAGTDTLVLDGSTLTATAPDGGAPRPHRLDLAGYDVAPDGLVPRGVVAVEVAGPTTAVEPAGGVVQVNAGDLTFAAVRSEPAQLAVLRERAGQLPDSLSRALAVTTAWDMLVKGELGSADVLAAVAGVLAVETAPGVAEPLLGLGLQLAEEWTPLADVPDLVGRLAAVASDLVDHRDLGRAALRTLAATAGDADQLAVLDAAAADDVDLAWRVAARRAELGEYDAAVVAELSARDPDPDAAFRALAVRGSRPDADAKEEVWQAVMVDRSVPSGSTLTGVAQRFWRPLQADLLVGYAERYLDVVSHLTSAGMLAQLSLLRRMFPYDVVDADLLDRAATLAVEPGLSPTVRTTLLSGVDTGRRMLAARSR